MKKIFTIIAMLIAVAANAQLKSDFTTFKVGAYVFYPSILQQPKGGGQYVALCSDRDEAVQLKMFLNNNKKALEKKFDVFLCEAGLCGNAVVLLVYDRRTYNLYLQEMNNVDTGKTERIESLNRVIAPDSPTRKNISVYLHCD